MRRRNVTSRILFATVSAALPLALSLMLVMSYFMGDLTDTIMLGMLQPMAKTAAQNVENRLHTLSERFFILRENPVLRDPKASTQKKLWAMNIVSAGREYAWQGLYEPDGSLLTGSEDCPRNISGRELYPLMRRTENLVIEKTTIGNLGPEIAMGLPIMKASGPDQGGNDAVIAYLVGSYKYDVLSDVLRDINIGAGGTAFIIDQDGYIIAHKELGRIFSQEPVRSSLGGGPEAENIFVSMVERQTGSARVDMPGGDLFVGYSPIKGTLWALGIQASRSDFMTAAQQALFIGACVTIAVLTATILFVGFFNRRVLSIPLAAITDNAQQLAKGNFGGNLPVSVTQRNDEIGQLGAAFDRMSSSVHEVLRDIRELTAATSAGDLGTRANPQAYPGDFQRIVAGMNASLDGICVYLDSMPGALLLFNRQGKHVYHNKAMAGILLRHAMSADDPMLFSSLVVMTDYDGAAPGVEELFTWASDTLPEYERELALPGVYGQEYSYTVSLDRMHGSGETGCIMLILNDVTPLAKARTQAEAASRAKSDFLSRMSHEMRTPMNAIIGMASIGLGTDETERKHYCLEKIAGASQHLLGVINDILDMAKIEADKFELSPSNFNLGAMLQRVVDVIRFHAEEKQQHFAVAADTHSLPGVFADEQRMAQVITNLLSNAVKFTPKYGHITLHAELIAEDAASCSIRIAVSDTGIGLSEEQVDRLFKPFEQADGSISRKFGGTGLGLAISKRIMEKMGSTIHVASTPGEGTTFSFEVTVPTVRDEQEHSDIAESACEADSGNACGIFRGRRVLLAEDVEINREIIASLLEHTGLEIVFACDGIEAVEAFLADPQGYDVILMDVQMPRVDGCEATRRIRVSEVPRGISIPIIAMTANVFREDIERCLASGMNGHLGKPIDADQVIDTLAHYFTASGKSAC